MSNKPAGKPRFLRGTQMALPTEGRLLYGELCAKAEISDGKPVMVVFQGDESEEQVADEIRSRHSLSVCICGGSGDSGYFMGSQAVYNFPTYIYFRGGHEISRLEGDGALQSIEDWISKCLQQ